jgi:hypothetical protein
LGLNDDFTILSVFVQAVQESRIVAATAQLNLLEIFISTPPSDGDMRG